MNRNNLYLAALAVAALAGCGSRPPVPVSERVKIVEIEAPTPAKSAPAATSAPEGKAATYTVKKGDTLYRIALDHGQDYKDLVSWNKLDNPNRIEVGQQLQVAPPEGPAPVAVVRPVVASAPVEAKSSGANTETYKREPRGGKVVYSEQALAKMRESEQAGPAEKPQERPTEKPAEKVVEKPADKPAPVGDDAIDWAWPAGGKVQSTFVDGAPGKESNKGIDLAGKTGEAVQAAAAGKVVYAGSGLRGYGNLVIVRHNATYLSAYAHNSKILVKEGQAVTGGQKIAEIGSTDADQPKLHFEIRRLGKPVDPLKYLPTRP